MLKPGDQGPSFDLPCAIDGRAARLRLEDLRSEQVVLFFYPRDFSFICPTEITGFQNSLGEFENENCSVVGASVDSVESHLRWAAELGGISYPLLADEDGGLTRAVGVLDEKEKIAFRATFILDQERIITYALASPINVGRSVVETLRVVRALRTGRLCPAEWMPGMKFGPPGQKY